MADIDRREFMQTLAALAAAEIAARPGTLTAPTARPAIPADTFVGIQMGPHTLLDEGIAPALDLIQETKCACPTCAPWGAQSASCNAPNAR